MYWTAARRMKNRFEFSFLLCLNLPLLRTFEVKGVYKCQAVLIYLKGVCVGLKIRHSRYNHCCSVAPLLANIMQKDPEPVSLWRKMGRAWAHRRHTDAVHVYAVYVFTPTPYVGLHRCPRLPKSWLISARSMASRTRSSWGSPPAIILLDPQSPAHCSEVSLLYKTFIRTPWCAFTQGEVKLLPSYSVWTTLIILQIQGSKVKAG